MSSDLVGNLVAEFAPATPAAAGQLVVGPEYRNKAALKEWATVPGVSTLYELFQQSLGKHGSNPCLGSRSTGADGSAGPYEWLTYSQVAEKVDAIGSGLAQVGLQALGRVGVFGANSPEWMITMQACNRMSLYCVPLYDSLGENAIEYIITHSESTAVFTSAAKFPILLQALPKVKGQVKTVVIWGEGADKVQAAVEGIKFYSFAEFVALGAAHPVPAVPPGPQEYCTIMYTSGTTGDPKGVLLTHDAMVATVAAQEVFLKQVGANVDGHGLDDRDVMLSYLPLAHIFDRAAEELMLHKGGRIGYWRGDIKGLVDDIAALQPTLFIGVPRVFDRIYAGVLSKIDEAGGLKALLFHWGFRRKMHSINSGVSHKRAAPLFDKLVFSKVKQRLGGQVRLIVTGGAPLAKHVEEFLRVTMCCPVVQGYGLTESCAASFIAIPDVHTHMGTVGAALPSLGFRLEAVPEMNYDPTASPPRGELCLRGPSLFSGYYKDQEKTAEVLTTDGWFHTGDIAELSDAGALKIIDRKKNIFKLSQGEYIAVEKLEGVLKQNAWVEQLWVYGNSFESTLVAVVVPKEDKLVAWGKEQGIAGGFPDLCANPTVNKEILTSLTATGKEGKLKGFEIVKAIHLEPEQFAIENDLMTPTFKLKRPQLQKKYQAEIDAMYAKINGK